MHLNPIVWLLASTLAAESAFAQQTLIRDFARDQRKIWSSPFRQPQKTALIGLPLAGATAGLMVWDQKLINHHVPQAHPWALRLSHPGDLAATAGSTVFLWATGRLVHNDTVSTMGRDSFLAVMSAMTVTAALKTAAARQRPDQSNHWSFPSGHAMTSFAIAGSLASNPKTPKWLKIALPAVATGVSVARVGARRHYPSDVAVGAALGWLIGRATHH